MNTNEILQWLENIQTNSYQPQTFAPDESVMHDYQTELAQDYYNESLPGQDSDYDMSYTSETRSTAASVQDGRCYQEPSVKNVISIETPR